MLVRVGSSNDVAAGAMRVFDVGGTKVNVASVGGNTAGIVGAARVSKRGRGFRKHHQSRATAGRSQSYQWMEPLTKSAVSAITTIRARTPTTVRAAFER